MEWRTEVPAYWILVGANKKQRQTICSDYADAWNRHRPNVLDNGPILWMEHGLDTANSLRDLHIYGHQVYGPIHLGLLKERIINKL